MNRVYRETYAEINLKNLLENYRMIEKMTPGKVVIPVVKANAYGHGVIEVVEHLASNGVDYFAVSLLEEALEIRDKIENIKILVMGVTQSDGLQIAAEKGITVTISNFDQIDNLRYITKNIDIHIKIDTGMNRLGFKSDEDIKKAMKSLSLMDHVNLEGIYTHFSTADVEKTYYDIQLKRFENVLKHIDFDFKMVHVSNSSSSIKYESDIAYTTHARLGISLYGLTLEDNVNFLKTTFTLKTKISEIKQLEPGDKVGYGATYTAQQREYIGVLPIGYADGFIRKNKNGFVEINGKKYQIIGNICMDQLFIKIDENIDKTDDVILFGGMVSTDEVADRLETINYEVICQITSRVPRKYIR